MLLLSFLATLSLSYCEYSLTVNSFLQNISLPLKKGAKICINASQPRSLVIFQSIDDISVELVQDNKPVASLDTGKARASRTALFLKEYGYISLYASKDTNVAFSMIVVSDECGEEVFYTNWPNTQYQQKSFPHAVTCVFYAMPLDSKFRLRGQFGDANSEIQIETQTGTDMENKKFDVTNEYSRNTIFYVKNANPSNDDFIEIQNISPGSIEPSIKASGFIQPRIYPSERQFSQYVIIGIVFIALLSVLAYILYIAFCERRIANSGYRAIDTEEVPEIL